MPERELLPPRRPLWTQKTRIGGQGMFLGCGEYEDGRLGEIFLDMHKAGSAVRGFMHALATTMSIGLQHGVPLQCYVDALKGLDFEPNGPVLGSPLVNQATSVVDFVVKELEATYKNVQLLREQK